MVTPSRTTTVLLTTVLCAAFELFFLRNKFPLFTPSPYQSAPIELARIGSLRIGAIYGHHGVTFVRLSATEPVVLTWERPDAGQLIAEARAELQRVPLKAAAELGGYLLIVLGVVFGTRELRRRTPRFSLRVIGVAIIASLAVACLELPLAFGYGASMWSTWVGPGAYSYSYTQQRITMIPGESVAHRTVLEAINLAPLLVMRPVERALTYVDIWITPPQTWWALVLRVAAFYACIAGLLACVALGLARFGNHTPN